MIIDDLLKQYKAKFTLEMNGENEINPNILKNAKVIRNDNDSFVLHEEDENGLFELIVNPPNIIVYNYYDPDGELYMSHEYSDEIGLGN